MNFTHKKFIMLFCEIIWKNSWHGRYLLMTESMKKIRMEFLYVNSLTLGSGIELNVYGFSANKADYSHVNTGLYGLLHEYPSAHAHEHPRAVRTSYDAL